MTKQMYVLGDFEFSAETAAPQTVERNSSYNWPSQHVIGRGPVSEFVGVGEETLTLKGEIYPLYKGGLRQVDTMREMAAKGTALNLSNGMGDILGKWVITGISESHSKMFSDGAPRIIGFTLNLRRYINDDDL